MSALLLNGKVCPSSEVGAPVVSEALQQLYFDLGGIEQSPLTALLQPAGNSMNAPIRKKRTPLNPGPLSVGVVQALKKGVKKCLWDGMKWIPIPDGSELLRPDKPEALVKPLQELQPAKENDGSALLGNRFLCRGGGLLFVGSSGIGKSTAVVQMGICWAVGSECFGIRPPRPLKILYVQAENDEGDLCEMREGVINGLKLTKKELELLKNNFICVFESSRAGEEFVTETLEPLLEKHSPDLLLLDPALSYIGGSANEQETVGGFLRNQLNPLLKKHNCGVLIVHHTNKPNAERDGRKKLANDFAYAGTGSAEWANWARAVLVLSAKNDDGVRTLQIGKRFRLNWLDWDGKPVNTKYLQQAAPGQGLFYSELTAAESLTLSSKKSPLVKVLHARGVLPEPGEEISKEILMARITEKKLCGRDKARTEVIPCLVDQGYLEPKEVPRHGARPEIHYVRTEQIPGRISFKQANAGIGRVNGELSKATVGVSEEATTVGVSEEAFRRFAAKEDKENYGKKFLSLNKRG
jgi:AAA domain